MDIMDQYKPFSVHTNNGTVAKLPSSKTGKNGAKKQGLKITVSDNSHVDESSEAPSKNGHFENLAILQQPHNGFFMTTVYHKECRLRVKKNRLKPVFPVV